MMHPFERTSSLRGPAPAGPGVARSSLPRPESGCGRGWWILLWFVLLSAPGAVAEDAAASKEYQVKAAFLYNFAKYVEWPANAYAGDRSPFVIGILGPSPFGTALEQMVAGRAINQHPILVKPLTSAAEVAGCNILYVSAGEKSRYDEILASLRGAPVLTVGEGERFLEKGGVIAFIVKDDKVRFQIDLNQARAGAMSIHSRLLSVAEKVLGKGEEAAR